MTFPAGHPGWVGIISVRNTHHPLSPLSSSLWDCLPLITFLCFYAVSSANANSSVIVNKFFPAEYYVT